MHLVTLFPMEMAVFPMEFNNDVPSYGGSLGRRYFKSRQKNAGFPMEFERATLFPMAKKKVHNFLWKAEWPLLPMAFLARFRHGRASAGPPG